MPRTRGDWASAQALWVTVDGWAAATRRRLGGAWVLTPAGLDTGCTDALPPHTRRVDAMPRWHNVVPQSVRTAVKDLRTTRAALRLRDCGAQHLAAVDPSDVAFVWQHHDIFHDAGGVLARRWGCPLVSFVHSPQVWEARRWGVRRPGWGTLLERIGERPQLVRSDVVACVSDEVASEVTRLGVDERRIVVSPMAVDTERFNPNVSGERVRRDLGLNGCFVIGWTGSFRRFHALDFAIEAFALARQDAANLRLLLVGDGFEREHLERLASASAISESVIFTGNVSHYDLPEYVRAMDVALLSAWAGQDFHYSPLKLREYLASSCAVVAPRIGEIVSVLRDGRDAVLYEPGDINNLAASLLRLRDAELRRRLGEAGRELMLATGTWDIQLQKLLQSKPFTDAVVQRAAVTTRA